MLPIDITSYDQALASARAAVRAAQDDTHQALVIYDCITDPVLRRLARCAAEAHDRHLVSVVDQADPPTQAARRSAAHQALRCLSAALLGHNRAPDDTPTADVDGAQAGMLVHWLALHSGAACPRCLGPLTEQPALSRTDSTTQVCPPCGRDEALRAATRNGGVDQDAWPVGTRLTVGPAL